MFFGKKLISFVLLYNIVTMICGEWRPQLLQMIKGDAGWDAKMIKVIVWKSENTALIHAINIWIWKQKHALLYLWLSVKCVQAEQFWFLLPWLGYWFLLTLICLGYCFLDLLMSRLSTKNYKPRATGSLHHLMLKVFCAIVKTAPYRLNYSTRL